jgi:hypothetical protein
VYPAVGASGALLTAAVNATGNARAPVTSVAGSIKAYFAQFETPVAAADSELITANRIFAGDPANFASTATPTLGYTGRAGLETFELDLPDLSTPTTEAVALIDFTAVGDAGSDLTASAPSYAGGPAAAQRDLVAAALQSSVYSFEYVTDTHLNAASLRVGVRGGAVLKTGLRPGFFRLLSPHKTVRVFHTPAARIR